MPAKICLVWQKNSLLLGISPIIKQALSSADERPPEHPNQGCSGGFFSFRRKKEVTTTRRTPNPEDFWKFTDEEMETAKGTDLPDLLEHLGYTVRRLGSRYHTTREMDSIRIKDRRTWKRYSNGTGGDAITFLQEFCGKDFREAVNYLLEFNGKRSRDSPAPRSRPAPQEEKPAFALPIANGDQRFGVHL